jgi:Photosynthesis system II assembly factor YCF48
VPITVAAAALVLFVQPYWHRTAPQIAVQHAPAAIASPAEQPPPPKTETLAGNPAVPAATPPAPTVEARSRDAARFEPGAKAQGGSPSAAATPAVPPAPVEATPLKDRVGVPIDQLTLQKAASAAAAAPAPPAASEGRSVIATGVPPAASASPTRPVEDRSAEAPPMTEKGVAESLMLTARVAATQQPGIVVRSAEGSTQWRVGKPGSVQRSNDAGATWETQGTGVSVVITSGAAPSDSVCWLVGKSGVVLQSTDGRSWRRVPFPHAIDLISVVATDARTATVTTAAGRTFTTTDGGRTWK